MRARVPVAEIERLATAGWPTARIVAELGCSKSVVNVARRRMGDVTPRTRLSKVDPERVADMTRQGMTAATIAEALGCTERTVQRLRVKTGTARPAPRFMTPDEIATAEAMLADGCSVTEIARTLGRSDGSLNHRFSGRGWTHQQVSEFGAACAQAARRERAIR